jgi:hypothetical protein
MVYLMTLSLYYIASIAVLTNIFYTAKDLNLLIRLSVCLSPVVLLPFCITFKRENQLFFSSSVYKRREKQHFWRRPELGPSVTCEVLYFAEWIFIKFNGGP